MPNERAGRGPGSEQAGLSRGVARLLLGGVAVVVLAVVLGSIVARPGDPSGIAAAISPAPSPLDESSAATGAGTPTASGGASAGAGEGGEPGSTDPEASGPGASPPGPAASAASIPPTPATPGATGPVATPAATPSPAAPSDDPGGIPAARLQRKLDAMRKKLGIPGVSVAIVWDDGRRWLGASGQADVKRKEPMTTGTAFALASVSKTLTAAVVLQLVEEGKLSLDTPVAPLLPAYKLHPQMTVRQLLDHTSGLPDYFRNAKIDRPLQAAPDATWTAERTWRYVPKKRPDPGNLWIYSNANYLLLGELVEKVTGRPLAEEVRSRLLDPLSLETAWYQAVEEPKAEGATGYRILSTPGGGVRFAAVAPASDVMPFRSVVTAADGAGSIAATALDAARWMQAYAGGDVVSDATRREQVADMRLTRELRARMPYGLGIQGVPVLGHRALGHSGRFVGFRNEVRYLPDDGLAIAVLTNQGSVDPGRIERALLKILLPTPVASASAKPSAQP